MFRKKKTKLIKKSLTWYKSQNFNKLKENQNIERTPKSSHFQEKELKKYAHLNRCDKCFKTIMRQTYITKELTAQ